MSYIPPVCFNFETASYYVILVGLELGVLLPKPQNMAPRLPLPGLLTSLFCAVSHSLLRGASPKSLLKGLQCCLGT